MSPAVNLAFYKHSINILRDLNSSLRVSHRALVIQSRFNALTIDSLKYCILSDVLRD